MTCKIDRLELDFCLRGPAGEDGSDGVGVPPGGLSGQVLAKASDSDYDTEWVTAGGTVTSVSLAAPSIFSVSGSPVTTSGTITVSLETQGANQFWAGPSSGPDATPVFRGLEAADIPDLSSEYSPVGHDHDDRYYTESEVDSLLLAKQDQDDDLDALSALTGTNTIYYRSAPSTWTEVTIGSGLSWSSGTLSLGSHSHVIADVAGLQDALDDKQPLDATLTAFAALAIAANTLTIGVGVDAFSQTSFAANSFPARASTGNLEAKTITDFGLSLIDDSDAATARSTLGLGTIATQNANAVAITGGTINGTTLGTTTPAAAVVTSLHVTGQARFTEQVAAPTGTSATVNLSAGNLWTLDATNASGDVIVSIIVPSSSASGSIIVVEGASPRVFAWFPLSGTLVWLGSEPDWVSLPSTRTLISWRYDGTYLYFIASESS